MKVKDILLATNTAVSFLTLGAVLGVAGELHQQSHVAKSGNDKGNHDSDVDDATGTTKATEATSADSAMDTQPEDAGMEAALTPRERAIQKLRAAREAALKEAASDQTPADAPSSNEATGEAPSASSASSQRRIDLSRLVVKDKHIVYDGATIPKLGYNSDGTPKTPLETRDQIRKFVESVTGQEERFSFTYPAHGEEKMKVLVFTDPTCPYCQRLHQNLDRIRAAGVSVHYMMYPRALANGLQDTNAGRVLTAFETAWCDGNPSARLDAIYTNGLISNTQTSCTAPEAQGRMVFPYAAHYFMAKMAGVDATPITVTSQGEIFRGFTTLNDYLSDLNIP